MSLTLKINKLVSYNVGERNESVRVAGRNAKGKSYHAYCFGALAAEIRRNVEDMVGTTGVVQDAIDRGLTIIADGEFKKNKRVVQGREFEQLQFEMKRATVLGGPSVKLFDLQSDAAVLYREVLALEEAGDAAGALERMKTYVARLAGIDEYDVDHDREIEGLVSELSPTPAGEDNPELAAIGRFLPATEVAAVIAAGKVHEEAPSPDTMTDVIVEPDSAQSGADGAAVPSDPVPVDPQPSGEAEKASDPVDTAPETPAETETTEVTVPTVAEVVDPTSSADLIPSPSKKVEETVETAPPTPSQPQSMEPLKASAPMKPMGTLGGSPQRSAPSTPPSAPAAAAAPSAPAARPALGGMRPMGGMGRMGGMGSMGMRGGAPTAPRPQPAAPPVEEPQVDEVDEDEEPEAPEAQKPSRPAPGMRM